MPEADCIIAQLAVYLARAPKSTESYRALGRCKEQINNHKGATPSVPLHLRNAPTKLMKNLGEGFSDVEEQNRYRKFLFRLRRWLQHFGERTVRINLPAGGDCRHRLLQQVGNSFSGRVRGINGKADSRQNQKFKKSTSESFTTTATTIEIN